MTWVAAWLLGCLVAWSVACLVDWVVVWPLPIFPTRRNRYVVVGMVVTMVAVMVAQAGAAQAAVDVSVLARGPAQTSSSSATSPSVVSQPPNMGSVQGVAQVQTKHFTLWGACPGPLLLPPSPPSCGGQPSGENIPGTPGSSGASASCGGTSQAPWFRKSYLWEGLLQP